MLCAAIGLAALGLGIWVWRAGSAWKAMAVPVALVALGQLAAGVGLLARTGRQVARLTARFASEPAAARADELTRMARVSATFKTIAAAELGVIVVALLMVLLGRGRPTMQGVGMGLLLQASVMLVLDLFAERRADRYVTWLEEPEREGN